MKASFSPNCSQPNPRGRKLRSPSCEIANALPWKSPCSKAMVRRRSRAASSDPGIRPTQVAPYLGCVCLSRNNRPGCSAGSLTDAQLRENPVDQLSMDIGQPPANAVVIERQFLVVHAEQMQQGGV